MLPINQGHMFTVNCFLKTSLHTKMLMIKRLEIRFGLISYLQSVCIDVFCLNVQFCE